MRLYTNKLKYKNFYSIFINNLGYVGPVIRGIDKSLHPFFLGRRNKVCYLDLCVNLGVLKNSFKVLSAVISDRGKVLVVGGEISYISGLLCLSNIEGLNIIVSPWDFSQIRSRLDLDLILIHEGDRISISESEGKLAPYITLNGMTVKGVPYPCNISLNNCTMLNWYLYVLINSCRRGFYTRNRSFNEI